MANKYVYIFTIAHKDSGLPDGTINSMALQRDVQSVQEFVKDVCIGYSVQPLWDKVVGIPDDRTHCWSEGIILDAESIDEAVFLAKAAYQMYGKTHTYHYEAHHTKAGKVEARNDEEALQKLRSQFGEHLNGVMVVYVKQDNDNVRNVWVE